MPVAPRPRCRRCTKRFAAPGKSMCAVCRGKYYGAEYRRQRSTMLRQWTRERGPWCPGYDMPGGHIVLDRDLQVDHITPVRHGGTSTPDNLTVLCRKCNIKKGDRAAGPAQRQL